MGEGGLSVALSVDIENHDKAIFQTNCQGIFIRWMPANLMLN
jgi:hypothetical protein